MPGFHLSLGDRITLTGLTSDGQSLISECQVHDLISTDGHSFIIFLRETPTNSGVTPWVKSISVLPKIEESLRF